MFFSHTSPLLRYTRAVTTNTRSNAPVFCRIAPVATLAATPANTPRVLVTPRNAPARAGATILQVRVEAGDSHCPRGQGAGHQRDGQRGGEGAVHQHSPRVQQRQRQERDARPGGGDAHGDAPHAPALGAVFHGGVGDSPDAKLAAAHTNQGHGGDEPGASRGKPRVAHVRRQPGLELKETEVHAHVAPSERANWPRRPRRGSRAKTFVFFSVSSSRALSLSFGFSGSVGVRAFAAAGSTRTLRPPTRPPPPERREHGRPAPGGDDAAGAALQPTVAPAVEGGEHGGDRACAQPGPGDVRGDCGGGREDSAPARGARIRARAATRVATGNGDTALANIAATATLQSAKPRSNTRAPPNASAATPPTTWVAPQPHRNALCRTPTVVMDRLRSLAIASEAREKMVRSADARSMASAHQDDALRIGGGKPSAEVTRALAVVARGRVPSPETSDAVSPVARARARGSAREGRGLAAASTSRRRRGGANRERHENPWRAIRVRADPCLIAGGRAAVRRGRGMTQRRHRSRSGRDCGHRACVRGSVSTDSTTTRGMSFRQVFLRYVAALGAPQTYRSPSSREDIR